jgi:hypothetical protein
MSDSKKKFGPNEMLDLLKEYNGKIDPLVKALLDKPMEIVKDPNNNKRIIFYRWFVPGKGLECMASYTPNINSWHYNVIDESFEKGDGNIYPEVKKAGYKINKVVLQKTIFKLLSRYFHKRTLEAVEECRKAYSNSELAILENYELAIVRKDESLKQFSLSNWNDISKKEFPNAAVFKTLGFDLGDQKY